MANGRKLVLQFAASDGKDMKLSYNYAKNAVTGTQVNALMEGIITNGVIFAKTPIAKKGAKIVTTSEQTFDLES